MKLQILLRRLISIIAILALVSVTVFIATEILPGDAATAILGPEATPENLAALRAQLGLDRPAHLRYLEWAGGLLRGDWGKSLRLGVPVGPLLAQRLGNSLVLAALAFALGVPIAIGLGVIAGMTRNRWPDYLISTGILIAVSLPEFVSGAVLIIVFAAGLGWLPTISLQVGFPNLVLPALTIMLALVAHIARMTRASVIETMGQDYIRTARAKGLTERLVILRHTLPNALLPTITVVGINLGWLVGGLVVVESVFAYPGLGRLLVQAISSRDLPLVQGAALVIATTYCLANWGTDLVYRWLDPQIDKGGKR